MGIRLQGKFVAQHIEASMAKKMQILDQMGIVPRLAIIRVGDSSASISYENSIIKKASSYGVKVKSIVMQSGISNDDIIKEIEKLNNDQDTHGIMFFTPLPKELDESLIRSKIDYNKDVDCLNMLNYGNVFSTNYDAIMPCTAKSAFEFIMFAHDNDIAGKHVAVVNSSNIVGLPLSVMLSKQGATVTVCNSRTPDLKAITKESDIVVTGVGKARIFDDSYFKDTATVIDVGLSMDENKKLAGDVDYDKVIDKVEYLTYHLNGVGLVTTVILISHAVECCLKTNISEE